MATTLEPGAKPGTAAPPDTASDPSPGTGPNPVPRTALLRVRELSVTYPSARGAVPAVRGVSFEVRPGEVFGLVGESGSGKSSVCSAILGMLPDGARLDAEGVEFEGRDLARLRERELRPIRGRRIALVPQQPMTSLSPTTPIGRQLRWYLGERLDDPSVRETLASIGLAAVLDRGRDLPGAFSGGQLQRLVIAIAALAHEPALLLADEPTTTLDATVQAQVLKLLLTLREQLGLAVLYVSHDLAVVSQLCDRVGVMYGGRLVETAPVAELFGNPRHPYTRALISAMPAMTPDDRPLRPIPGSAEGANLLPGCPFAPRCAERVAACDTAMPATVRVGRTRVACHRVPDEEAK
ncbi:ABC transporter ATP-binding protein [Yinghuangia seranimata]|uniref:ABC transporter ATP-binding protein n=1 Tax=Yinghuangia seranimata TaxID=408067 RepID=UPI00248CDC1C|nr:ABC transporter ATP-binding protein [Yinghuangia seranimata]MDI2125277.1 ABC transporter ATP-binding protein [Yinghuangia seranimata]